MRGLLVVLLGSGATAVALLVACSSSPAPPAPEDRILPMTIGHKWVFSATAAPLPADAGPDATKSACDGEKTSEVTGPGGKYDGGTTLRYHSLCTDPASPVDIEGTGDRLVAFILNADGTPKSKELYLDEPVQDGHQWDATPSASWKWTNAGTVTVPAGKFTNCFKREHVPPNSADYIIFCRGVGQVRYHTPGYDAELKSKNF